MPRCVRVRVRVHHLGEFTQTKTYRISDLAHAFVVDVARVCRGARDQNLRPAAAAHYILQCFEVRGAYTHICVDILEDNARALYV